MKRTTDSCFKHDASPWHVESKSMKWVWKQKWSIGHLHRLNAMCDPHQSVHRNVVNSSAIQTVRRGELIGENTIIHTHTYMYCLVVFFIHLWHKPGLSSGKPVHAPSQAYLNSAFPPKLTNERRWWYNHGCIVSYIVRKWNARKWNARKSSGTAPTHPSHHVTSHHITSRFIQHNTHLVGCLHQWFAWVLDGNRNRKSWIYAPSPGPATGWSN